MKCDSQLTFSKLVISQILVIYQFLISILQTFKNLQRLIFFDIPSSKLKKKKHSIWEKSLIFHRVCFQEWPDPVFFICHKENMIYSLTFFQIQVLNDLCWDFLLNFPFSFLHHQKFAKCFQSNFFSFQKFKKLFWFDWIAVVFIQNFCPHLLSLYNSTF